MKRVKAARAAAAALICALTVTAVTQSGFKPIVSHAETQAELEAKIAENQKKIKEYEDKIKAIDVDIAESEEKQDYYFQKFNATQDQINLLNNRIYDKEQEILAKEDEIAAVELKIEEKENDIEDKTLQIEMLDTQNKDNIYKFGQIIRAMYITDSDDYMSIIAGSSDFYDIFVRSEIMKSASEQNLNFMNELLDDIHKLEDDKVQLGKDKEQLAYDKLTLEEEKDTLEDEKVELDEEKKYNADLSDSYISEYNQYASQIANLEYKQADYANKKKVSAAEIQQYEAKIDEIIRQAQLAASNSVVYEAGEWRWPLDPQFTLITTSFGFDAWRNGNHGAIDIGNGGINGANIYASKGGEVIVAKTSYTPGYDYGMYVVIDHGNGFKTLYAHCSAIYVSVGQFVKQGHVIASVGSTGWSTGPHLHFEMRSGDVRIDPLSYVKIPQ